jgi:hypothetical protein
MWPEAGMWIVAYTDGTIGIRCLSAGKAGYDTIMRKNSCKSVSFGMGLEAQFQVSIACLLVH